MTNPLNSLKKYWPATKDVIIRYRLEYVAIALILVAVGYGLGRYAQPAKVVTKEVVHEVVKTQVVEKTKTEDVVDKSRQANVDQKVHRVVVETKHPDGTQTTTTTEDVDTDASSKATSHEVEVRYVDRVVTKYEDRIVEKVTQTLRQPDWRLGLGIGVSVPHFLGQGDVGVPGLQGFVIQAQVDRRVVGPLWLGAWLNTQGTVGLNLAGSW